MSRIAGYIREFSSMDDLSAMDSSVHRRHPIAKIIITIVYIIFVLSFQPDNIGGLTPMLVYPVVIFMFSDISIGLFFHKFRIVLPFLIFLGIFNPIINRTPAVILGPVVISNGMISFITLIIKELYVLAAVFLLVATTGIEGICAGLKKMGIPRFLLGQLLITYRYISLFVGEFDNLSDAYMMRSPGRKGISYKEWGSFFGGLLLRSINRSKAVYESMKMRGYTGVFENGDVKRFNYVDLVYIILWICILTLLRYISIADYLGKIFL